VTAEKLDLYDRFHDFQHRHLNWPPHTPESTASYTESFVDNPIPTEEWRYRLGRKLVGVGYVDPLPNGLSAIYFFHDPGERRRSLGTFNVLCVIREAAARGLEHVFLGYYVEGCRSLEYKARFRPNEILDAGQAFVPTTAAPPPAPAPPSHPPAGHRPATAPPFGRRPAATPAPPCDRPPPYCRVAPRYPVISAASGSPALRFPAPGLFRRFYLFPFRPLPSSTAPAARAAGEPSGHGVRNERCRIPQRDPRRDGGAGESPCPSRTSSSKPAA
jgi:hypothetical protein